MLKIAYFGSPDFSADFLERIINDRDLPVKVELVVTQPDKPVGRKQILTPSPVKVIAQKHKIPVIDNLSNIQLSTFNIDLCLVFAYGKIIPAALLSLLKYGFWNIHPSLLPKYRGASPVAFPLIMGETKTGVSLMQMDEKMDHGPIIDQAEIAIQPDEKRPGLTKRLSQLGYKLFRKNVTELTSLPHSAIASRDTRANGLKTTNQNDSIATFTKFLKKEDGYIPLPVLQKALHSKPLEKDNIPSIITYYVKHVIPSKEGIYLNRFRINPGMTILNLFRGLYDWPGIWTLIPAEPRRLGNPADRREEKPARLETAGKRLKITDMELVDDQLAIKQVQLEGKKPVDFATFNSAYKIFT